jgi:hypothetical protein
MMRVLWSASSGRPDRASSHPGTSDMPAISAEPVDGTAEVAARATEFESSSYGTSLLPSRRR